MQSDPVPQPVPQRLYLFWNAGEAAAPPVVQLCIARWRRLNPEYQVIVLDAGGANRALARLDICFSGLSIQAYSDILRVTLLEQGGLWADATVFPVIPLRDWITPDTRFMAFAAPGGDRALSSWFLAAEPNSPLITELLARIRTYWAPQGRLCRCLESPMLISDFSRMTKLRKRVCRALGPHRLHKDMAHFGISDRLDAFDPVFARIVDTEAFTRWKDAYPYFWFHYMINAALARSQTLRDYVAPCQAFLADRAHGLQRALDSGEALSDAALMELAKQSPVQKLRWHKGFAWQRCVDLDGML